MIVVYASIDTITDYITSEVASLFTATDEMYFIPLTWRRSVVFFGYSATVKLKYYKSHKSTRLTLLTKYILHVTSKSEGGNNKWLTYTNMSTLTSTINMKGYTECAEWYAHIKSTRATPCTTLPGNYHCPAKVITR